MSLPAKLKRALIDKIMDMTGIRARKRLNRLNRDELEKIIKTIEPNAEVSIRFGKKPAT